MGNKLGLTKQQTLPAFQMLATFFVSVRFRIFNPNALCSTQIYQMPLPVFIWTDIVWTQQMTIKISSDAIMTVAAAIMTQ